MSTIDVNLTSEDCKKYMQRCIEASIDDLEFLFFQKMLCDGIKELECKLPSEEVALFISSMIIQSIRFDMLYKLWRGCRKTKAMAPNLLAKENGSRRAHLLLEYFCA